VHEVQAVVGDRELASVAAQGGRRHRATGLEAVPFGIRCRLEHDLGEGRLPGQARRPGRLVHAHMVGVAVAAAVVVADHECGPQVFDERRQVGRDLGEGSGAECLGVDPAVDVESRAGDALPDPAHARVTVAARRPPVGASGSLPQPEPVGDPEYFGGPVQLVFANACERFSALEPGQRPGDDLAALTAGGGQEGHPGAARDEFGREGSGGEGFVVGVSVDEQDGREVVEDAHAIRSRRRSSSCSPAEHGSSRPR